MAKVLHRTHLRNVDISPYDDKVGHLDSIREILGADFEISYASTSIGTKRFYLKVKTLTLILHSNLYPLTNMGFINLGRARFLCDLINGAQIDIYAHIFQILGKMASQSAARTCLPFCNLIMKILLLKGIRPPKNGIVLPRQGPTLSHKHV